MKLPAVSFAESRAEEDVEDDERGAGDEVNAGDAEPEEDGEVGGEAEVDCDPGRELHQADRGRQTGVESDRVQSVRRSRYPAQCTSAQDFVTQILFISQEQLRLCKASCGLASDRPLKENYE